MKISIGCDEVGFAMKQQILSYLAERADIAVEDVGCYDTDPVLYPDIALVAATRVQQGQADRAILICGTGIGVAIASNKLKGIRAAVCHDIFSTERSVMSNNAQVMCLGSRVIAPHLALMLVKRWLELEFERGPSSIKVRRITEIESG